MANKVNKKTRKREKQLKKVKQLVQVYFIKLVVTSFNFRLSTNPFYSRVKVDQIIDRYII